VYLAAINLLRRRMLTLRGRDLRSLLLIRLPLWWRQSRRGLFCWAEQQLCPEGAAALHPNFGLSDMDVLNGGRAMVEMLGCGVMVVNDDAMLHMNMLSRIEEARLRHDEIDLVARHMMVGVTTALGGGLPFLPSGQHRRPPRRVSPRQRVRHHRRPALRRRDHDRSRDAHCLAAGAARVAPVSVGGTRVCMKRPMSRRRNAGERCDMRL
jgi:hypothetical protein